MEIMDVYDLRYPSFREERETKGGRHREPGTILTPSTQAILVAIKGIGKYDGHSLFFISTYNYTP